MNFKLCNNGLSVIGIAENGMYISISVESNEYKQWLAEGNTPEPEFTEEELAQKAIQDKIAEAELYLRETDWVDSYKLRHDLGLELIPEDSSKWVIINKRAEYIEYLKEIN